MNKQLTFTLVVFLVIVVLVGIFWLASKKEAFAQPQIFIEPASWDWGEVIYGQVAEKDFLVKNSGKRTLEIYNVSTSCGCTQAKLNKQILAPGESTQMLVTFDPAVHSDDNTDVGAVRRVVYLRSNDPQRGEIEVNLKAKVIKP